MSILVTGATSQIGAAFVAEMNEKLIIKTKEALNLLDYEEVNKVINLLKPDYVLHTAAYTDVYQAESAGKDACWKLNVNATANLFNACAKAGSKIIFISCDRVFGGYYKPGYVESDPACPTTVYGYTKLAAEHHLLQLTREYADRLQYWIIRTGNVFEKPWRFGKNFVMSMLSLAEAKGREGVDIPTDVYCSFMYAPHLAKTIAWLLEDGSLPNGTYHIANDGNASLFEFARHLSTCCRKHLHINPVSRDVMTSRHYFPAGMFPKSRVLNCSNFKYWYTLTIPTWQEAVEEFAFELERMKSLP